MSVTVKNIHSGDRKPTGYASWLEYWKVNKGMESDSRVDCANSNCKRLAEHGGHVKKVGSEDEKWYIVPLCVPCNENKDNEFEVEASYLVRASQ